MGLQWWGIVESEEGYSIKSSSLVEMYECIDTYSSREEAELFLAVMMSAFNRGRQSVINKVTEAALKCITN